MNQKERSSEENTPKAARTPLNTARGTAQRADSYTGSSATVSASGNQEYIGAHARPSSKPNTVSPIMRPSESVDAEPLVSATVESPVTAAADTGDADQEPVEKTSCWGNSFIVRFAQGICMACADSVPGVSGSTVAFILGFYDTFVSSLHAIVTADRKNIGKALKFLVKLGIGWVVGMAIASTLLSQLLNDHIYFMSSLFIGLTVAAIPIIAYQERASFEAKASHIVFVFVGFAVVAGFVLLRPLTGFMPTIDFAALDAGTCIYLAFSGVLGISAMLLPGISGSAVLLILGAYIPTITSLGLLVHGDTSGALGLAMLIVGVLIGLICTVRLVKRAIEKHRSQMMFLVMGMLVASIIAIAMGPTTTANPLPALGLDTFSIPACIIGAAILLVLEWIASKLGSSAK